MLDPDEINEEIARMIGEIPPGDPVLVLCNPVKGYPVPEADSGMTACSGCGRAVWIGTKIWEALPERAEIICKICKDKHGIS